MALTNFPQGVSSLGMPVVGSGVLPVTAGNYWFVSSTLGSNGNDGSLATPYATLAYVLTNKVAADDVVVVLPQHAESVIAAGGLTCSIAGVRIVGIGNGADRPTFTFKTATTASFLITGASVSVTNVVGVAGINALSQPFDVRASDCTLNIEWQDGTSAIEALRAILTTAAADRLAVNLVYRGFTAGSAGVNAVRLVGCDGGRVNVDYYGICTTAVVEFVTTACTNVDVTGTFYVSGTTNFSKNVVDTVTGSTWYANGWDAAAGRAFDGGSGAAISGSDVASVIAVQEGVALSATAVMVNANTLFTVAGGPIEIMALVSECVSANDATASTLQYSVTPTIGSATTISGASASLANAAAGASVTLAGTALATAALLSANGPNLMANPGTIYCPAGTIKAVIGVGSTTGTWRHRIRYKPLATGVTVS